MAGALRDVIDLICLVYHEGRNSRHVIKAGKLENASKYAALVNLPHNRDDAWQTMGKLRAQALTSGSIGGATAVFKEELDLGLDDLAELYEMPIWRHSAPGYGGNKWAGITSKVRQLVGAMNADDGPAAAALCQEVLSMSHNTGRVADKLQKLNSVIASRPTS